jgi:hypothetical protein
MKKLSFLLLFILFTANIYAQNYLYSGKVLDSKSKKGLAFVSILVVGEQKGVQTDIDGKFKIYASKPVSNLRLQYVGYETKEVVLNTGSDLFISLNEKENKIKEVVVFAGDNPAHRIIKKAIDNKDKNNPEKLNSFKYMSYNKFYFTGKKDSLVTARIDSYSVNSNSMKELKLKDSTAYVKRSDSISLANKKRLEKSDSLFNTQYLFLTETVTERSYLRPEKTKEKIKALKVSGLKNPQFVLIASQFQSFSFYKDYLKVLDKNYLSPLATGSTTKYFFNIEDTLYKANDSIFVISFRPMKGKFFDGLKGLLYINTDGFAIQNVIAEPSKSSYFNIKIQQQYEKVEGAWFPMQLNTDLDFGKSVQVNDRTMFGVGRTYIKDLEINIEEKKKNFNGIVLDYDNKSIKTNSDSLFNKYRVDALNVLEKNTYRVIDSIGKAEKLDEKIKYATIIAKGSLPVGKYFQIDLKRILSGFNDFEGIRLGMGVSTSEKFSKRFSLASYFAWGTKDNKFKYGASLDVPIYNERDIRWSTSYIYDVIESGSVNFKGDKLNFNDTYRNLIVSNMDFQRGFETSISIRSQKYVLHHFYASQYRRNVTNAYTFSNDNTVFSNTFDIREIGISTRWAYGEEFMRQAGQRISIGTKYPVVFLKISFNEGLSNNFTQSFLKYDLKINKSFTIRNIGKSSFQVNAGYIDGKVPYPFAYNGRANYNGSFTLSSQGYFETMLMNEFLSSQYAAIFYHHDFGKLLYQSKYIKPGLAISTAAGWGELNNNVQHNGIAFKTMEKGYYESGLIISDILSLKTNLYSMGFGAGVYYRYGPYRNTVEKDNLAYKLNFSISF